MSRVGKFHLILCLVLSGNPAFAVFPDTDLQSLIEESKVAQQEALEHVKAYIDQPSEEKLDQSGKAPSMQKGKVCRTNTSMATADKAVSNDFVVFVSFSMSDESLISYAHQAQKYGARVVIRGLIDDSFAKTQKRLTSLKIGVEIDPNLFEESKIQQVPAILIKSGQDYDRLHGHVSLDYALEKFADAGNTTAQKLIQHVRQG